MTATIAKFEPTAVTAGLTWEWKRTLTDYPAGTWTLTYYVVGAAYKSSFNAAADGTDHLVDVAPSATLEYAAGAYTLIGVVTDGTDKHEVYRGALEIAPDPAQLEVHDPRSHARKTLDAIEAVLEGRASQDQAAYSITTGGVSRSLSRTPIPELLTLRDRYRADVAREEAAERIAKGLGGGRRILTRFGSS